MFQTTPSILQNLARKIRLLAVVIALQLLAAGVAQASHLPLLFKGYYAVTNSVFVAAST